MSIVAIIPARGGSKRIPRKNIKLFHGQPMLAYSIRAAQNSGLFDRIIVSTDDEEIADIARRYGAETPFRRPIELADDYCSTPDVVRHAVQQICDTKKEIDYACCIYATAPFLQEDYLREGLELLKRKPDKLFSFSVTTFPFPIQRAIRINASGEIEAFFPEYYTSRSQDLEQGYHDAGQFYWGRAGAWLEDVVIFSTVSLPVRIPRHLVQDIDTEEDWLRAEQMYSAFLSQNTKKINS